MGFTLTLILSGKLAAGQLLRSVRAQVVGLQDSYHGDTLGAMDLGAPSAFNGPRQTPWRAPARALRLQPPALYFSGSFARRRWHARMHRWRGMPYHPDHVRVILGLRRCRASAQVLRAGPVPGAAHGGPGARALARPAAWQRRAFGRHLGLWR